LIPRDSQDADDLDIEPILLDIVTYHAEQLTESLKIFIDERLGSAGIFHKDDIAVATTGQWATRLSLLRNR